MFKSAFALAAIVAASFGGVAVEAAEVGIRNEAGYSTRAITGGHQWSEYNGVSVTRSRTVSTARTRQGDMGGSAGAGLGTSGTGTGNGQDAARSRTRTVTRNLTLEAFEGGSRNGFHGNDNSVFSSSSVFAR